MSLSNNKAVRKAYETGEYTDSIGTKWRKGMDGWFDDTYRPDAIFLARHHDFVEMIEKEHPEDEDELEAARTDLPDGTAGGLVDRGTVPLTVILVEEDEGRA